MKLGHTLIPCTKINSKSPKDLNIRQGTIKLLEEIIGKIFSDISHTNVFLGQSPMVIEINQWDLINLKAFAQQSKPLKKKKKRQPMEWENIVANNAANKGLISKIYK